MFDGTPQLMLFLMMGSIGCKDRLGTRTRKTLRKRLRFCAGELNGPLFPLGAGLSFGPSDSFSFLSKEPLAALATDKTFGKA